MTATMLCIENSQRSIRFGRLPFALAMAFLLLLIPIKDARSPGPQEMYERAHQLFLRGDLIASEGEAQRGYELFLRSSPAYAAKFELLRVRSLIWQGRSADALAILSKNMRPDYGIESAIERRTLEGAAYTYLSRYAAAAAKFKEAQQLCDPPNYPQCDDVPIGRGILALEEGHSGQARQYFLDGLTLARSHRDPRAETSALVNLGWTAAETEHYDEAVEWSTRAYRMTVAFGWEARAENIQGNLGWAYLGLGDRDRALQMFVEAERRAGKLGDRRLQIKWLTDSGYIYRDQRDYTRAAQAHRKSLDIARQLNSHQDIVNALEDLAHTDIMSGKIDEAAAYLDQLSTMVGGDSNRLDQLDMMLARGEIAAARRQDQEAEGIFRAVEDDAASQTSMRLGAEHQLARLYEAQDNTAAAESMYRKALTTFEAARDELKNEESKLPFLTNATPIYDDYIHFLVRQGRMEEALAAADQSRARMLAQGLGLDLTKGPLRPAALRGNEVARRRGATILFYWLGEKQSYLWAITPSKTSLFTLPAQDEITPVIERYRKELLTPGVARSAATTDGEKLYRLLVDPGADLVAAGGNVVVVCDGPLSLLNFETLVVPGRSATDAPHYWIEDANVVSAPSLSMLAAAKPAAASNKLLLMGNAISPNADYPELPMGRAEMRKIAAHFAPADETVFAQQAASPVAYLSSPLKSYAYIHFVAHGVASRTDPLDSAIILSRTGAAEDSFKLYAREIIQHPIDAQLVTISACYGGGTRSYAGEGLVGLSWAFLRAGAHHVIGALWEASDDSTPQLMDKMYAGLAQGMPPSSALRQAKLALLHSDGKFRQPFYWAPFQLYAGM